MAAALASWFEVQLTLVSADFLHVREATVVRWRRYGKDRLYVTSADGVRLGWRDLLTGQDHIEAGAHAAEYQAALARRAVDTDQPSATSAEPAAPEPAFETVGASRPQLAGEDLATRRAGAAARERAVALRDAAPIRTLLARAMGVRTNERAWRLGADGEEKVAVQLARLTRNEPLWRVLHAVPVGERGADIDHVVIGPGGVFTLNAKHHPAGWVWVRGDTFIVNGTRHPYLRNSRFEATRAARLLNAACGFPVIVTGIVVPVDADRLLIKQPPADVRVVNRMALVTWLP